MRHQSDSWSADQISNINRVLWKGTCNTGWCCISVEYSWVQSK